MGWNTTVLVINDALNQIENDPDFGRKLARACTKVNSLKCGQMVDISAGNHCNAASVIESHHADETAIITVGGNLGIRQFQVYGWGHHTKEGQEGLIREWADKLGFRLVRKATK